MLLDRAALLVVLALCPTACAVGATDAPATGSPLVDAPDPTAPSERDAPLVARSAIDEGPAYRRTNAIIAWGFEPASADCNGWSASGATSIRAAPPHSGAYACKLCSDGSAEEITLSRRVGTLEAGRYAVTAWVRRLGGGDAPIAARVTLDKASSSAGEESSITLKDDWIPLRGPLDVTSAVASARITVAAVGMSRAQCILVDDVVVERTHAFLTEP